MTDIQCMRPCGGGLLDAAAAAAAAGAADADGWAWLVCGCGACPLGVAAGVGGVPALDGLGLETCA